VKFSFLLIFLAFVCSCGPTIDSVLPQEELQQLPEFETRPVVRNFVQFQDVVAPLQEGRWQLVGETGFEKGTPGFPEKQVTYASVDNGAVDRVVTIWHQKRPSNGFFTPFRHCADGSYLHSVKRAPNKCWHLRAVNLGVAGNAPQMNTLLANFARQRGAFLSPTMLGVRFVQDRHTTRHYIEYMWSSDLLYGKAQNAVWLPEDWSKSQVTADVRKGAIANGLTEWAVHWEPAIYKYRTWFRKYADE